MRVFIAVKMNFNLGIIIQVFFNNAPSSSLIPLSKVGIDRLKEVRDFASAHSSVLTAEMTNMEKEEAEMDFPLRNQRYIPLKGPRSPPSAASFSTGPSSLKMSFSSSVSPSSPPSSSSSPSSSSKTSSKSLPTLYSDSLSKSSPKTHSHWLSPNTPSDSLSKRLSILRSPGGSGGGGGSKRRKREKRAMNPRAKDLEWSRGVVKGEKEEEEEKRTQQEVEEEYVLARRNTSGALFSDTVVGVEGRGVVGREFCSSKLLNQFKEGLGVGCEPSVL